MKGKWRVRTRSVAGSDFYQVYRLRDVCADPTPKNIETYGGYQKTEKEAINLAELLNKEGA